MREREGLIARIRQIRRTAEGSATAPRQPAPRDDAGTPEAPLQALQTRIEHLEQLVEALQDSVHRDSER